MACTTLQMLARAVWSLARRQHGVVARWQLLDLGASRSWIEHRIGKGRLHPIHRGVYAVGRPQLAQEGRWMAAVLACGREAWLSHGSAACLWQIRLIFRGPIEITLSAAVVRRIPGIRTHRTVTLTDADLPTHRGIPVITPTRTLIDLATILTPNQLEAAVNEADVCDLIDPETLRRELEDRKGQPGTRPLRALLDRATYRMTESELERRFLRIVKRAGLLLPETQEQIGGRVDFHWHSLGLVVETDGWRYHRTPVHQAKDNRRMQAHAAAGRTAVRFSNYEVRYEPDRVAATLASVVGRIASRR